MTNLQEAAAGKRIYGLDILRAAAILFVVQAHSVRYIVPHVNVLYYWHIILDGVGLFFVLSGFLIGGILIRTIETYGFDRKQLFHFWFRRWFRTLPNYFLVLLVLLAGYRYAFGAWPDKTVQFFFFLQNFASPHPHFFPEAWSLAVEEWFYLLIPLGLFVAMQFNRGNVNKRKIILYWICFVLAGATLYRTGKTLLHHDLTDGNWWDHHIRKQVLSRLDSIVYGFLGAYLHHYKNALWEKRKNLTCILGLILLFGSRIWGLNNDAFYQLYYISLQSVGALLILPKLQSIVSGKGFVYKALTFISVISYSMYLLNYTIVSKIILPATLDLLDMDYQTSFLHSISAYLLFWGITIIMSYILYRFYEKPVMKLRSRFVLR